MKRVAVLLFESPFNKPQSLGLSAATNDPAAMPITFHHIGKGGAKYDSKSGIPFYGNIYEGNDHDWDAPSFRGKRRSLFFPPRVNKLEKDPSLRAAVGQCPYFALQDMAGMHDMDPKFLDPGILTLEEHQLLLLFSRAYYEKWSAIHRRPRKTSYAPVFLRRIRGTVYLLRSICNLLEVPETSYEMLTRRKDVDDSHLIAINPDLWQSAFLPPDLRSILNGQVLEECGFSDVEAAAFFHILDLMRTVKFCRHDVPGCTPVGDDRDVEVAKYVQCRTLYDFSMSTLGLSEPYGGQIKAFNFRDETNTKLTLTMADEDNWFDFLCSNFYRCDLRPALSRDGLDPYCESLSRFTLSIIPQNFKEQREGQWF